MLLRQTPSEQAVEGKIHSYTASKSRSQAYNSFSTPSSAPHTLRPFQPTTPMLRNLLPGTLALSLIATAHAQPAAAPTAPPVPAEAAPPVDPATLKKDSSYFLGFSSGKQFSSHGLTTADLDTEAFVKGLLASFESKSEIDEKKFTSTMQALGDVLQEREKVKAAENLEAGKKFLAENGKREGVTTTKSGLQYEVLAKGGDQKYVAPKEGEESDKQFLVNYKGSLIDGTQFDASPEGEPVPMTLGVIDGFKEALTTMPVGAKWKLFIPSDLAYGEQRQGSDIAPNSVLIFELELVKIEDAPAAPSGGGFPIPIPGQGE